MRYVFVSYNYSPDFSTPESWLKRTELYTGIQEQLAPGNEVINIKQINYEGNHQQNGVDHRFVRFYQKQRFFPFGLNRYISNQRPDIMVVQGLHHPIQVILLALTLPQKTRLIVQHHAEKPFNGWKRVIQKIADKFIAAYLFASKEMGQEWVEKGIIRSIEKVHEVMEVSSIFFPADKDVARVKTGVCGHPAFLWVGRLNLNKDPMTVVRAFLKYAAVNADARLYMIFHKDELRQQIDQLIAAQNAGKNVQLIGRVQHDDLTYWFNSADFYLSGSHYEGSGAALCEALSCGCVPIVTDIPSFRMMTDNGACGYLYPPGDEQALLAALLKTKSLDLPQQQTKALNYFQSTLSFPAIARKIKDVAESL